MDRIIVGMGEILFGIVQVVAWLIMLPFKVVAWFVKLIFAVIVMVIAVRRKTKETKKEMEANAKAYAEAREMEEIKQTMHMGALAERDRIRMKSIGMCHCDTPCWLE